MSAQSSDWTVKWSDPEFRRQYRRAWRLRHIDKAREYDREWKRSKRKNCPGFDKHTTRKYRERNRETLRLKQILIRKNNPEKWRQKARKSYQRNKAKRVLWRRAHYIANRRSILARNEQYRQATIEKRRTYWQTYRASRMKRDPEFALKYRLRARINTALRKQYATKAHRTIALLGCDIAFFKSFLEAQFLPGMTWENHGALWQIDHVIPVSSFDLRNPDQQKRAFHYSNCRPLLRAMNIAKSDHLPEPHQPLLV